LLTYQDQRLEHVLVYFSATNIDRIYRQRVMLDIIRLLSISNGDIRFVATTSHTFKLMSMFVSRLRIFKYQAQIMCNTMSMTHDEVQEYQVDMTCLLFTIDQHLIVRHRDYSRTTKIFDRSLPPI
jgi:hypothetical protein